MDSRENDVRIRPVWAHNTPLKYEKNNSLKQKGDVIPMNTGDVRIWTTLIAILGVATSMLDLMSAVINFMTALLSLLR